MRDLFEVYDQAMECTNSTEEMLAERGLNTEMLEPVIGEFCVLSGIPYRELAPIILLTVALGVSWEREVNNEARAILGELAL